ncbi:hypothetical protein V2E39_17105 [Chryseobacterium arthrosphaerae]|uniref:Uncharacterized protein n=1 Tax=Chryseobacterium arthrosphaerae TaxID=651561 RepID=A0ABU7R2T9_9FLAO
MTINITPDVKKCIMDHTSELDIADVSRETGVGYHTVRRLRLCELDITNEERLTVTKKLMEKALINSKASMQEITNDQVLLKETLKNLENHKTHEKSFENISKL